MLKTGSKVKVNLRGVLDDGRVIADNAQEGGIPFEFTIGLSNMPAALERRICQMDAGEQAQVRLEAKEAFGEYNPALVERVALTDFPHSRDLKEGEYIYMATPQGPVRMKVAEIGPDIVTFDYNHEFAGQGVIFTVEVLKVLPADWSAIERENYFRSDDCACSCQQLLGGKGGHRHTCAGH